jgi:hypothetical protein
MPEKLRVDADADASRDRPAASAATTDPMFEIATTRPISCRETEGRRWRRRAGSRSEASVSVPAAKPAAYS